MAGEHAKPAKQPRGAHTEAALPHKRKRGWSDGPPAEEAAPSSFGPASGSGDVRSSVRALFEHHRALDACLAAGGDPSGLRQAYDAIVQAGHGEVCVITALPCVLL